MVKNGEMVGIDDIINIVAVPLIGAVPDDKEIIKANNIGKPVVLKPKSRSGIAYGNIAMRITGAKVPVLQDEKKKRFSLFGRK